MSARRLKTIMSTSMMFHLRWRALVGQGQCGRWNKGRWNKSTSLPALDKGGEPVDEEVHAELGGEEGSEDEVECVEGRAPVRFVEGVSDLSFDDVQNEVLCQKK